MRTTWRLLPSDSTRGQPPPPPVQINHSRRCVQWYSADSAGALIAQETTMARVSTSTNAREEEMPSPGVACIIQTLKRQLKARGAHGMIGLGRKFRIMDDDGSKSLSLMEFKKAMREMELPLSDKDMRLVF